MASEIRKIACCGQYAFGPTRDLAADFGQSGLAGSPLDELHPKLLFEIADLHRQSRLRDRAGLGGATEMPMLRQGAEVSELTEREHLISISY